MKAWMIIAGVTLLVAFGSFLIRPKEDIRWVKRLNLPRWVAIVEPAIPVIWTVIFVCGAASAILVWQQDPGSLKTWLLMGLYLLVEIVIVAYIPLTLRLRSLAIGTVDWGAYWDWCWRSLFSQFHRLPPGCLCLIYSGVRSELMQLVS
jgi:tryptophan-rich sensory protein